MEEKEKLFLEIIDGFQWKYDLEKYPDSIFGFKNEDIVFEISNIDTEINHRKIICSYRMNIKQDLRCFTFYFNHSIFWRMFKEHFEVSGSAVNHFQKRMIKKYFKIINVSAGTYGFFYEEEELKKTFLF